MRKLARIGVLVLVVAGVLGSSTQPAAAAEVTAVVFAGEATFGAGIALPCLDAGTVSVADCPVPVGGTSVTPGTAITGHYPFLPRPRLYFGATADRSNFAFDTDPGACLAAHVAVDEATPTAGHLAGAGTCAMAAGGFADGYCALNSGTMFGGYSTSSVSAVPPLGTGTRAYNFAGGFTTVATVAVLMGSLGNATSGEQGMFTGLFTAVPQSPFDCLDNASAKKFTVVGAGAAVLHDIPPH